MIILSVTLMINLRYSFWFSNYFVTVKREFTKSVTVHISVISCIHMKVALSMISFLREPSFLCFSDQIGDVWEFPFLHPFIFHRGT